MTRQRGRFALALLAIALIVAGCSNGRDAPVVRAADGPSLLSAQVDPRKVVFTADLVVRVADAARATEQAVQLTRDADGLVFAQRSDLEGRKDTRLTLKVPPDRFEPVLVQLAGLGRGLNRDVKAQDVTEEVVDVDGRLRTALASADRLRSLVRDARSTADIVAVEAELTKREGEIESLQGRLRVLNTQVDLATINLRLTERGDLQVNHEVPAFQKAVLAGWVALVNVVLVVTAVAGFLLPFAPLALVAGWLARRSRRRRVPPFDPASTESVPAPAGR